MEGLKASLADLAVYLHPSKTKSVSESIRRELNSLLFKFNENFDGVVLAYEIDEVMDKRARILSGLEPYVGVRLKANLLLFSPKPDMFLEGKVVKLARESLHIIVLGFSACVISEEDIREELKYKIKHDQEVFRSRYHKKHVIRVGSVIRFLVKSFDEDMLHISGSLVPACTGSVLWFANNMKDQYFPNRTGEKQKEKERTDTESIVGEFYDENVVSSHSDRKMKKSRRQKVEEVS
ncbi:hypothetical protein Droror1_Dr00019160 [Drosera rotundifolia]